MRLDIARKREAWRDWGKGYRTRKRKTFGVTPTGLTDEPKESYTGARRSETGVVPGTLMRHVMPSWLSVVFVLFVIRALCVCARVCKYKYVSLYEQRGGGGEERSCAARLSLFVFFALFSRLRAGLATE